jgi:hypothetical protein
MKDSALVNKLLALGTGKPATLTKDDAGALLELVLSAKAVARRPTPSAVARVVRALRSF